LGEKKNLDRMRRGYGPPYSRKRRESGGGKGRLEKRNLLQEGGKGRVRTPSAVFGPGGSPPQKERRLQYPSMRGGKRDFLNPLSKRRSLKHRPYLSEQWEGDFPVLKKKDSLL